MLPHQIFISYRRCDTAPVAHLLREQLLSAWPDPEQRDFAVFLDCHSIDYGRDFPADLRFAVEHCRMVLVLIGSQWLTELNQRRQRVDKVDWVLQEVSLALQRNKVVIPVLVNDTLMPECEELPDGIAGLAERNAMSIRCRVEAGPQAKLDGHAYGEVLRIYREQMPTDFDEITRSHRLDDLQLLLEVQMLNQFLEAALASPIQERRQTLLARAVHRACLYLDRGRRKLSRYLALLRDYPSRQREALHKFVGEPSRLADYLLGLQQALGIAGNDSPLVAQGIDQLVDLIPRVLHQPPTADDFNRAWTTLHSLVCRSGACVQMLPDPLTQVQHLALASNLAATGFALTEPSLSQTIGLSSDADAELTRLTLAAVIGQAFIAAVEARDQGFATHIRSRVPQVNTPVERGYWDSLDQPISLPSALKQCTGSTAEAELTRRRLAGELAAQLMQYAPGLPDPEHVQSALAMLLGNADPRLRYAPAWTVGSEEQLVALLASAPTEGGAELIIAKLRNYSEALSDLIDLQRADAETFTSQVELPDSDLF